MSALEEEENIPGSCVSPSLPNLSSLLQVCYAENTNKMSFGKLKTTAGSQGDTLPAQLPPKSQLTLFLGPTPSRGSECASEPLLGLFQGKTSGEA